MLKDLGQVGFQAQKLFRVLEARNLGRTVDLVHVVAVFVIPGKKKQCKIKKNIRIETMQYYAFFQKLPNVILFLFKSGKHFLNPIHNMSSSEVKNVIALSKGTNKKRFVKTFHLVHIISCSSPRY